MLSWFTLCIPSITKEISILLLWSMVRNKFESSRISNQIIIEKYQLDQTTNITLCEQQLDGTEGFGRPLVNRDSNSFVKSSSAKAPWLLLMSTSISGTYSTSLNFCESESVGSWAALSGRNSIFFETWLWTYTNTVLECANLFITGSYLPFQRVVL